MRGHSNHSGASGSGGFYFRVARFAAVAVVLALAWSFVGSFSRLQQHSRLKVLSGSGLELPYDAWEGIYALSKGSSTVDVFIDSVASHGLLQKHLQGRQVR